ncbi:type II secretion system F family protein [Streptomyces sp. ECR3]|uniref:type II secretion system F family protein n=1 Tax=Streptomyces sp. ECR3 TaxID=3400630 RepID=UPI003F196469
MTGIGAVGTGTGLACAGAAAWLLGGRNGGPGRARWLFADADSSASSDSSDSSDSSGGSGGGAGAVGAEGRSAARRRRAQARVRGLGPEWWSVAVGALLALLGMSVLPLLAGVLGVPALRKARVARTVQRDRERRGEAVIALCAVLAGEVRAGRQPGEALRHAAQDSGGLGGARAAVLAAARFGGDVPGALTEAARGPGAEGLLGLAACWRVAVDRGAGLAAGLDRLEAALRAERDQRADLRAQLAGARSTAVMLAGLPVLGLLLGTALGADPLHVVLHTGPGLMCLLAGAVLEAAGLWWALRIVRGAEET